MAEKEKKMKRAKFLTVIVCVIAVLFVISPSTFAGTIVAWGSNSNGQCAVPSPNTDFTAIAAGAVHSLGLKTDGSIVAWGSNLDESGNYYSGQCVVPNPNTDFVAISAGREHSLGLKTDGSIVAWGSNRFGQCTVPSPNTDFIAIVAGARHSLGLKADGSIVTWGNNDYGQCTVPSPNTDFTAIAAGTSHSLGLKTDGSIVAWGNHDYGLCTVPSPNTDFTAIAAGGLHSLGLKTDGLIVAWGSNGFGQCTVPSPNTGFTVIAASGHSLGLKIDGSIVAWGSNGFGQCNVPSPNTDFIAIVASTRHSLGLKTGTVATPTFSPDGGNFTSPVDVTISCGTSDAKIHYTTNGNDPTESDPVYSSPINISITTALKAKAWKSGWNPSGVKTADYTIAVIPPNANADGPYTIYVGDTLTLDASGSTDEHNNIVSYIWDLDDNNSFETDAGSNAVFDVNYTYLQSIGLLVNNTYNIHLKVTDGEGQSDVNDSTLTIIPTPALLVFVDIKPGSCPNPLNVKSSGVLPAAILGTADFDITTIDPTSIRLAGVSPLRSSFEDVAGPPADSNDCNCTEGGPDGFLDLTLKFKTRDIVEAIGDVNYGDTLTLKLTGVTIGERPIEGTDCILISGKHKPFNKFDVNKDGVVDSQDFAIFAENWLESSIVED